MCADLLSSIMLGPHFTFVLGEDGEALVVSGAAIAALSDPFHALINGPMCVASERKVTIPDNSREDFVRLCEFAYRGDYTIPQPQSISEEPTQPKVEEQREEACEATHSNLRSVFDQLTSLREIEEMEREEEQRERAFRERKWEEEKRREREAESQEDECKEMTWVPVEERFNKHKYIQGATPKKAINAGFVAKKNRSEDEDYSGVFLAHAKLYCIADRYLIEPLKALALDKLRKVLLVFHIFPRSVSDVTELVRFIYEDDNTSDQSESGKQDPLRELILEYMVMNVGKLETEIAFDMLLEEGGLFVSDFWRLLRQEQRNQRLLGSSRVTCFP